jgi:DNA-binding transcriptional MerR regulator
MTDAEAPPDHLLATEFTAAAGVSYRQLDYWTRRGVIRTADQDHEGSGIHRRYLAEDVPVVRLMGQILGARLNDVETVRGLAEHLLGEGDATLGPIRIYLTNN